MSRLLSLVAVVLLAGSLPAADPPTIADLVKQLGDPKFAVREAAQKELLRRGEGSAPELEKLAKGADAETVERIGKVRYALVGYKDDIRRLLRSIPNPGYPEAVVTIPVELRGLIAGHQPGAGDLLLRLIDDREDRLYVPAARAFVLTWEHQSADQMDAYIRRTLAVVTAQRVRFPAAVGTLVRYAPDLRFGASGWPATGGPDPFKFRARAMLLLDGKACGPAHENGYPFSPGGWLPVAPVAEGKHTVQVELEYEFTHRGATRTGRVRSELATMVAGPNDTADAWGPALGVRDKNFFRAALRVAHADEPSEAGRRFLVGADPPAVVWWRSAREEWAGLGCPQWELAAPVATDLCFDVDIRDPRTGKAYPADPILVPRGKTGRGYIAPRDFRAFARGRSDEVRMDVVLTPSRRVAGFDPGPRQAYPEVIEFERQRFTLVGDTR